MNDNKLTDNEIVDAMKRCIAGDCEETGCPLYNCVTKLLEKILDLIKCQKAEIESLKIAIEVTRDNLGDARAELQKAEAEIERLKQHNTEMARKHYGDGIKEFAERLKASAFACDVSFGFGREHCEEAVTVLEIDRLVKEMTEETP